MPDRPNPRQPIATPSQSLRLVLSLAVLAACSPSAPGTNGNPSGGAGNVSGGSSADGGFPNTGGMATAGNSANGGNPGGGNPGGGNPGGGNPGGGNPANGGIAGDTGSSGSAGTMSGGQGGAGGGAAGSDAGASGAAGTAGTAGSGAGAAGASGGAGAGCPPAATFCSGFEEMTLPTGAVYKANAAPGDWSRDFEVDTSVFRSGQSSLRVKAGDEAGVSGAYKMLAVPVPGPAFWVRFYIRQADLDLGGMGHNVFGGASGSDEPNDGLMVEFAEDVGIAFNSKDVVRWPDGYGRTMAGGTNPYTLAMGMWHCIEISYDSQTRRQQLFVNGMQQIDATDFPDAAGVSAPFAVFKFGFNQLHGPARKVWYDDVAVAATRINCL